MSVKYERLPMQDPDETAIDFSSPFTYESTVDTKNDAAFSYGFSVEDTRNKYRSTFTYDGWDPNKMPEVSPADLIQQSAVSKCFSSFVTISCYIMWMMFLPISYWFSIKTTEKYERIIVFRLGKLLAAKGPGKVLVLPCIDKWYKVDMRMRAFSVPPQMVTVIGVIYPVMLSDGAAIEVGAEIYYRVTEPTLSLACVQDLNSSTRVLCSTALAKHLMTHDLKDIHNCKFMIAQTLQKDINKLTLTWGVEIGKIELSQIKVLQEQNPLVKQANDPLAVLGQVLFGGGGGGPGSGIMGGLMPGMMPTGPTEQPPMIVPTMPELANFAGYQEMIEKFLTDKDKPATLPTIQEISTDPSQYDLDPERLLGIIEPHLCRELVCDVQTIFMFVFTDGGKFYMDLLHDSGSVGIGEPPGGRGEVGVTLTLTKEVMQEIFLGKSTAFDCYMNGTLHVDGSLSQAKLLKLVLDRVSSSVTQP